MGVAVGRQFRAAAHGVWSVLVCRDELVCIGSDSDDSDDKKQGGSGEEALQERASACLVKTDVYELTDCVCEDHDCKVVCDLQVVGLYLHAQRECEQGRSENGLRQP